MCRRGVFSGSGGGWSTPFTHFTTSEYKYSPAMHNPETYALQVFLVAWSLYGLFAALYIVYRWMTVEERQLVGYANVTQILPEEWNEG